MAMHTRRDLLRTSLLLGGALSAPRIWAATTAANLGYTAARRVVLVAGGAAFIDSVATVFAPAPAAVRAPAVAAAPATAPARTNTPVAINPAVQSPISAAPSGLRAANQISFALPCGGVGQPIANWLAGAVNHVPSLQDGSVCTLDYNFKLLERYDWTGGSISQVTWPVCDASSVAPAGPVITVLAATLSVQAYPGSSAGPSPVPPALLTVLSSQKYWRASEFLVTSNANVDLSRISSVSALTLAPAAYAGTFTLVNEPSRSLPFYAALRAGGMLMPGQSTNLAIQYGAAPGVSVTLRNCLVASVVPFNQQANGETIVRTVVTLNYADASLSISAV